MRSHLIRLGALTATGAMLVGLTMCARDTSPSTSGSPLPGSSADEAAARAALVGTPLGHVTSRDADGKARFILAAAESVRPELAVSSETAARLHLERHASALGLSQTAAHDTPFVAAQPFSNGASVVQFGQRVDGIEVFRARASVVLDNTKNLVSIASNLQADGNDAHAAKGASFAITPETGLANVYAERFGRSLADGSVRDLGPRADGDVRGYAMSTSQDAPRVLEATAKKIYFPEAHGLVPAYYMEILARAANSKVNEAYAYAISAKDGRVLHQSSLVANDAFNYRVWADSVDHNIPTDGPYKDYTPHPTGVPDKTILTYQPQVLVSMEGFNKNPDGKVDPWLAAGATTTLGNNVHAYSDRTDTHAVDDAGRPTGEGDGWGPGDIEADVTAAKTFDRTFDPTQAPGVSDNQTKAAVTQIFYTTNWLHDYWYDSGFNEAAGVAQLSNYGRGGANAKENDPLRAEAQDGADHGQSNNANMLTPLDGTSPRMQMFVWSGLPNRTVTTTPALTFNDGYGAASFGPQTFDITGDLVLSDDGTAPGGDACQVPTNVAGKIAVIDRGTCNFTIKGENAQTAGAIGILLVNNSPGNAPSSPGVPDDKITIPLIGLSLEDGATLKSKLAAGAVNAQLTRGVETLHDGTVDNSVVAHEWGHYLHHRLVTCSSLALPDTTQVGSCGGMSEGWADFDALMMIVREGDNLAGTAFPLTQYVAAGLNSQGSYFGIRRAPYSTDMAKNPFTFKHVSQQTALPPQETARLAPGSALMNEVHNVGEIWAETLFEGYVNMQNAGRVATPARSFQEVKRRLANYIVKGMQATPIEPTFVEQRDALLSTVWASGNKDDFAALAQGFAKRGLGVGAVAPPASSRTLNEAVESFAYKGELAFSDAKVDDAAASCDHDGVMDAGETGQITINVRNPGWRTLTGTKVRVTTTDANLTFGNGAQATIASLDPYDIGKVIIPVSVKNDAKIQGTASIDITVENADAFTPSSKTTFAVDYNFDDKGKASATDNIESASPAWTLAHGTTTRDTWSRQGDAANHLWHGTDLSVPSGESIVSPDLAVGTGDFTISFRHRYKFEHGPMFSGGPDTFFDGGVLEISSDGGTTWDDISKYVDPQYLQTLYGGSDSMNVVRGRKAWAGDSANYPAYNSASLNVGKALSGKTVKVRFRIGTDDGGNAAGWDIDDIAFGGITNLPFAAQVDDQAVCTLAVDAGVSGSDAGSGAAPGGGSNDDSGCSVSTASSSTSRGTVAGVGLLGVLFAFLGRRRRNAR